MNIEKDFVMKKKNIIYFDNAATTFKPIKVINKELEYLTEYTANSHRGDYNISFKVDDEIDNTRDLVAKFINAAHKDEIIFTSNTTESLNMIINGFFGYNSQMSSNWNRRDCWKDHTKTMRTSCAGEGGACAGGRRCGAEEDAGC